MYLIIILSLFVPNARFISKCKSTHFFLHDREKILFFYLLTFFFVSFL